MTPRDGPLVSVVIPAFDAERFIAGAVESVLSQTHANLELIVIDDGSRDDTPEIVRSVADPRVQLVSGPNRGVTRARNDGLSRSRGEAIAFLDADDRWRPVKLERQLRAMREPGVVVVGALMVYESFDGRNLGTAGQVVSEADRAVIAAGRLMPFPLSSALMRTDAVRRLGGFDETFDAGERIQAEDLELMTRLVGEGQIVTVPEVLGAYRLHSASASASDHSAQRTATRFVRARIASRRAGRDLEWDSFLRGYRPTLRQRYGDLVQTLYRGAGLHVAEGRWVRATGLLGVAGLLAPGYTIRRLRRQSNRRERVDRGSHGPTERAYP